MTDSNSRQRGIHPADSFIVQAPAGSGKTELLIQRFLALLAIVDEPEEILALTFTRKAAGEMRQRVIEALRTVSDGQPPRNKRAWKLAEAALRRSEEKGWRLVQHPARLNILTIDAFASGLVRQMPLHTGFGDRMDVVDDAQTLYSEAVEALLLRIHSSEFPGNIERVLDTLLLRCDHRVSMLMDMIASMLAQREQWLPLLTGERDLRRQLEDNLQALATETIQHADAMFPADMLGELWNLLRFAAANLKTERPDHPACVLDDLDAWPDTAIASLPAWKGMASLLLKKGKPEFYASVTKAQGFPADKEFKALKGNYLEKLELLSAVPELAEAIYAVRELPERLAFEDEVWDFLKNLFVLLKLACAELDTQISMRGQTDFTGIMLRALQALGASDSPQDLLLRLDRRLRHILIDEFQDTSWVQVELLERLTAGWVPDDGRSLFMVGDPMQSIYRFRKAEVGLFLRAATGGLAGIPDCEPLQLTRNFRSAAAVMAWVNQAFSNIFPVENLAAEGAVAYSPAEATRDRPGGVGIYLAQGRDDEAEARQVVALVEQARARQQRVGILARARNHLHQIMHGLDEAGIVYRATEVLPLKERSEIRDLRALTRALMHQGDRESWSALLRAPFCGLSMPDFYALLFEADLGSTSIWSLMQDQARIALLSGDGQQRLHFLRQTLIPAMHNVGRVNVRKLVRSTWLSLSVPALLSDTGRTNAEMFFDVLARLEHGAAIDLAMLDRTLDRLKSAADTSAAAADVELLTMHGAKGLQWDVVILPGLGRKPPNYHPRLLDFTQVPLASGEALLIAARPETGGEDELQKLVRRVEKHKSDYETDRLLYVACTRAENELYLLGHVEERKDGLKPAAASLLERLWPSVESSGQKDCYGAVINWLEPETGAEQLEVGPCLRVKSQAPPKLDSPQDDIEQVRPEFAWAGPEAAIVGNVMHAVLQWVAEQGIEAWQQQDTDRAHARMRRMLMMEGLSGELMESALGRCVDGLDQTFNSERGRWLLSSRHDDAHSEWALSLMQSGQVSHHIIDRSFVDDTGARWIVDYKTGSHLGGDIEEFLEREQERHAEQLQRYAEVVRKIEDRPIRLGLYFPMLDGWREWAG